MTLLQISALALVAVGGLAVVCTAEPLRQTMVLGIYGVGLTMLFFVFQAPDVALSEIVVSTVGIPLMVLLALRKVRDQQREHDRSEKDEQ